MNVRYSALDKYRQCKQIARDCGLFIIEKYGYYLVYRILKPKNALVKRTKDMDALFRFMLAQTNTK